MNEIMDESMEEVIAHVPDQFDALVLQGIAGKRGERGERREEGRE